jgi:hypothetical protein
LALSVFRSAHIPPHIDVHAGASVVCVPPSVSELKKSSGAAACAQAKKARQEKKTAMRMTQPSTHHFTWDPFEKPPSSSVNEMKVG